VAYRARVFGGEEREHVAALGTRQPSLVHKLTRLLDAHLAR
jgi:hypothetical protein